MFDVEFEVILMWVVEEGVKCVFVDVGFDGDEVVFDICDFCLFVDCI